MYMDEDFISIYILDQPLSKWLNNIKVKNVLQVESCVIANLNPNFSINFIQK